MVEMSYLQIPNLFTQLSCSVVARFSRREQSIMNRPTQFFYPMDNAGASNQGNFFPISDTFGFPIKCVVAIATLISCLFCSGSPSAVHRPFISEALKASPTRVMPFVIDPINGIARWRLPHLKPKHGWVTPAFAHFDAPATVVVKRMVVGVVAAALDAVPDVVHASSVPWLVEPMDSLPYGQEFSLKAATAFAVAACQITCWDERDRPTFTAALPHGLPFFCTFSTHPQQYSEPAKLLLDQVYCYFGLADPLSCSTPARLGSSLPKSEPADRSLNPALALAEPVDVSVDVLVGAAFYCELAKLLTSKVFDVWVERRNNILGITHGSYGLISSEGASLPGLPSCAHFTHLNRRVNA